LREKIFLGILNQFINYEQKQQQHTKCNKLFTTLTFLLTCSFNRETPVVVDAKEKVVEEVEDSPVVATSEEQEATPAAKAEEPAVAAPTVAATTEEKKPEEAAPAVESSVTDGEAATENGNGEAEVVAAAEDSGKFHTHVMIISCNTNDAIIDSLLQKNPASEKQAMLRHLRCPRRKSKPMMSVRSQLLLSLKKKLPKLASISNCPNHNHHHQQQQPTNTLIM